MLFHGGMSARRILVLGGTGWLGREVATAARGAEVVCLARGSAPVPDGVRLVRADRTRPGAYEAVAGQDWDEVVELAHDPALVEPALAALADRAAHWTLVSTVSVYASHERPGGTESDAVVEPLDAAQYPDAKVRAERASAAALGDRLLIARPGLIAGPGDPSDRFGYWPARLARGGAVVTPTPERDVQVIDVRDLADWLVRAGVDGLTGTIDAVGVVHSLGEVLATAVDVAGFGGALVAVPDEELTASGVAWWAGPDSLPLWVPPEMAGMMARDGGRYVAAGGARRPLAETIADTLADERARGLDRDRRAGLSQEREADVLRARHGAES